MPFLIKFFMFLSKKSFLVQCFDWKCMNKFSNPNQKGKHAFLIIPLKTVSAPNFPTNFQSSFTLFNGILNFSQGSLSCLPFILFQTQNHNSSDPSECLSKKLIFHFFCSCTGEFFVSNFLSFLSFLVVHLYGSLSFSLGVFGLVDF
jgi:hypothetical protein